jgi:spermidine/putrescine transport system substrate-binding protein
MTHEHEGSSIDLERQLVRYMAERRITRRQLLERIAAVGAAAALAPVIAACTSNGTPVPSSAAPATPGPTVAGASPSQAVATDTAPPTPVPTPEKELFVYNWDAYIGDTTIPDFESKYGVRVKYDKFTDADTQIATIRKDGKGGGYDITFPASTEIPGLSRDGIIRPLDLTLIPNAVNLGAEWTNPGYDPGNKNSMPYMWWTTGYAWNPSKIKDDLTSWSALWDDRFKGHLNMLDDDRECFAVGAFRLNLSANTTSEADLDAILALLEQQKPLVRSYNTDDIGQLTSGQVWITHAWSGDYFQMLADKPNTKYVIPSEGAVRGSDTMVVLSGAPHPVAANLFIDFCLDAKVSAANSNYIGYMGPNAAAQQYIDPTILDNPAVNPAKALLDKLTELLQLEADLDKYTQRWNQLKA